MTIDEVKLIQPKPGDTVVLRVKDRLTNHQRGNVVKKFSEFFPGCRVLIFDSEADIEVYPAESGDIGQ